MKYSKPEVRLVASAVFSVRNTQATKQTGAYTDSYDGAAFDNTVTPPAYEADE